MKKTILLLFLLTIYPLLGQQEESIQAVSFTNTYDKTGIVNLTPLKINIHPEDLKKFKAQGYVMYSDLGAVANGKTNDMPFIRATHEVANTYGLSVKADKGARYYIGREDVKATIKTNTDFGSSTFIIDDTDVVDRTAPLFEVRSSLSPIEINGLKSVKAFQKNIGIRLPFPCLVSLTNDSIRRYIRYGLNQNNGKSQTDIFLVDKNGDVNMDGPIIWDFDNITAVKAFPVDPSLLQIKGGEFITIANRAPSKYTYYSRNFSIERSNVEIDGLVHRVEGEGAHGAPYSGFISIGFSSDVVVKNCLMTGHKTYRTIGSAGKPVSMGSYDLTVRSSINVSFLNCTQTNDISDKTYWGVFASNYSKNLKFEYCKLSRFDAHMGVYNASISNSTLGYMGVRAIGSGTFTLENSTVISNNLISLRQDYGSTWKGNFVIRNCVFIPSDSKSSSVSLFGGYNSGLHDFGYTSYMPENIIIDGLVVEDGQLAAQNKAVNIFDDFNPKRVDEQYQESFPYVVTKRVSLKNVQILSGKTLGISENPIMFNDVLVEQAD